MLQLLTQCVAEQTSSNAWYQKRIQKIQGFYWKLQVLRTSLSLELPAAVRSITPSSVLVDGGDCHA